MQKNSASNNKASLPYYNGRGFPLESLSPSQFEEFVFGCLICVANVLDMQITGKPSGSGDGGFDVQGEVLSSKRLICVQCKRQTSPLGIPQLAKELAKVSATVALEGSDVGVHRFICTGGIRNSLIKQLREKSRKQLATEAGEQLATSTDPVLTNLRKSLILERKDPRLIAETYVLGLDTLTAWGKEEFDAALSVRWSEVLVVAERFFQIASVVREHPRALFDRNAYISGHSSFSVAVQPRLTGCVLPDGLSWISQATSNESITIDKHNISNLHELAEIKLGELALLIGEGGIGKSTALELLRTDLLLSEQEATLPVLISLVNYTSGSLDQAIHQELGVYHGTWRSLPDKVLLLCDGLNECPSAHVASFMSELKPLFRQGKIACVISTRGSTRHGNIVLPIKPSICVKVESITPIGIQRIAEQELKRGAKEFVIAYRSLADRSWAPVFWTPFSVMVALRLWRIKAVLPPTLSEMLEELLKAKCIRNSESPNQNLSADVVLKLAGALAYQLLIVDHLLECSALQAGRAIRAAKNHCADALGITDLSELEVVELLSSHELIQRSADGHLSFGHQLLAGALAAPMLSQVWRDHKECLDYSIADDAWVFAARLISTEHAEDFLKTALNIDVMLGARCAREFPNQLQVLAEQLIIQSINAGISEILSIEAYYALARLGSNGAIEKLRKEAVNSTNPIQHVVQRALSTAGDILYLKELLPKVEIQRDFPGKVSGGDLGIWEVAPLPIRLDLARHYLTVCTPGKPVKESLSLIAYERDINDLDIIMKHLNAVSNYGAWQVALYALHEASPFHAEKFIEGELLECKSPIDKANIIRTASQIGMQIDIRTAFECSLIELSHEDSVGPEKNYQLHQLISDVIVKNTLPSDLITFVESELLKSNGEIKVRLWMIATCCNSESIANYAMQCIEEWGDDLGSACNYFIDQPELAFARQTKLIEICERGLVNKNNWFKWNTWRVLTLIGLLGSTTNTAASLSAMIQSLMNILDATRHNDTASLSPEEAKILAETKLENARFMLGNHASHLIFASADAKELLSENDLLSLLHFDTHTYSGCEESLRKALSVVNSTSIDHTLVLISEPWIKLSGLVAVCGLGITDTRIKLLELALKEFYTHPAGVSMVCKAIGYCWNPRVSEMVMQTVAAIPSWSDYESQFFWNFIQMVAKNVDADDQIIIENAISVAKTSFAKRILGIWSEQASGERVGLSRLAPNQL